MAALRNLFVIFVLQSCFHLGMSAMQITTTALPAQGGRVFRDLCEGCRVSNGMGFSSHPTSCNCYVNCVRRSAGKLADYANPWVSYTRCCPCHMSFSIKLLTCVDYRDKRSDCYDGDLGTNPCNADMEMLPATNPNDYYNMPRCSAFLECTEISDAILPKLECCPAGTCFSPTRDMCDAPACDEGSCANLHESEKDDCECEDTSAPVAECAFTGVTGSVSSFMGVENMRTYECAAGTCWDQDTCTCVRVNNTGYNQCKPFAELSITSANSPIVAEDGRGNSIWTEVGGAVSISGSNMIDFSGGYVDIAGIANTYLSDKFALCFDLNVDSTAEEPECLVSTCIDEDDCDEDSLVITFDANSPGDDVFEIDLTYKDKDFWRPGVETTESVELTLTAEISAGTTYRLYLFYGWEEQVAAGIYNTESSDFDDVEVVPTPGQVMLLSPPSGFVFGQCGHGEDFDGRIDNIELWRGCKSSDLEGFYEEILDDSVSQD